MQLDPRVWELLVIKLGVRRSRFQGAAFREQQSQKNKSTELVSATCSLNVIVKVSLSVGFQTVDVVFLLLSEITSVSDFKHLLHD